MAQDIKIDWYGHPYLPDGTQDRTRIVPAGGRGEALFAGVGGDVPVDTPHLFGVVDVMQGYTYRAVSVNVELKRQVLAIEVQVPTPIPVLLKALAAAQASLTNDADAVNAAGGDPNAPGAKEEDE